MPNKPQIVSTEKIAITELSTRFNENEISGNGRVAAMPAISVIVPTFNNGNDVAAMHRALRQGLEDYGQSFEIILSTTPARTIPINN